MQLEKNEDPTFTALSWSRSHIVATSSVSILPKYLNEPWRLTTIMDRIGGGNLQNGGEYATGIENFEKYPYFSTDSSIFMKLEDFIVWNYIIMKKWRKIALFRLFFNLLKSHVFQKSRSLGETAPVTPPQLDPWRLFLYRVPVLRFKINYALL